MATELLKVIHVKKDYPLPKKKLFDKPSVFRALHGISLAIKPAVSFGIVGESGCGKSTLARLAMGLERPTEGQVLFDNQDLDTLPENQMRKLRSQFQMVFQDPYGSLNPRQTIARIVSEPLDIFSEKITQPEKQEKVKAMLHEVGLNAKDSDKYPHEFSGGQRQRIAIARALITRPSLIIADEPVSALDVSVQAQVLNLMMDLQEKYELAYMFISHDLGVVHHVTNEIAVLYLGRMVESGLTDEVFQAPQHPYTRLLIEAIPVPNPLQKKNKKRPEELIMTPPDKGCPFFPRCDLASSLCSELMPELVTKNNRKVACHHV